MIHNLDDFFLLMLGVAKQVGLDSMSQTVNPC